MRLGGEGCGSEDGLLLRVLWAPDEPAPHLVEEETAGLQKERLSGILHDSFQKGQLKQDPWYHTQQWVYPIIHSFIHFLIHYFLRTSSRPLAGMWQMTWVSNSDKQTDKVLTLESL